MDPGAHNLTELTLEFEALAHSDRTVFRWESVAYASVELLAVRIEHPEITSEHVVEVPNHLWTTFVEIVLGCVLLEKLAPLLDESAATQPDLDIPPELFERDGIGRHRPDAPTAPNRRASALSFLRCSVVMVLDGNRRSRVIEGGAAMDLYSRLYAYAADSGISLPR